MKTLIAIVACSLAFLFLTCSNPSSGNGSDVGNAKTGLTGHLVDGRTGTAADSAMVRVYPVYLNKMAQALGKMASGGPAIDSTTTDQNGAYRFDSLDQGIYSVEGEKIDGTDTLTVRISSVIYITSKDLGYDTLQLPGWIRGKVVVQGGESAKNITCYIPGTSYIAITNDTGGFKITSIPKGTYSLSVTSTRFNDTTIYGLNVTPNHETNAGIILLGLDRSKNEHDVWGMFDSTYDCSAIDSIVARVSGDSIPVDSPRVYSLDWRPALFGYSGFIYVPAGGFFWTVDIWVYDTLGHRIGAYRVPTINRATGDVQVPNFNPFNSIPIITLNDATVSINDSVSLHPIITKLADDSILSMAWDIGNTGTFTPTTAKDTLIIAPSDSTLIPCVFRVTDKLGNIAAHTALVTVITDAPVAHAGNDTVVSKNSRVTLHGSARQRFGTIVKWEWNIGKIGFKQTSTGDTTITAPDSAVSVYTCVLRVTDDDGQIGADTVNLQVEGTWNALGNGTNGTVWALAVDRSGNLYAGGEFSTAGGVAVNSIVKWNGNSWNALGNGTNSTVWALAVDRSGNLYAGGEFDTAGGIAANHIAKWDGGSWSALGNGTKGTVVALAVDSSGNLYASGEFDTASGIAANRIAKWNGNSWSALGSGTDTSVMALAVDDFGTLYAGGEFTTMGGITANYIAQWDGGSWSALGSGMNGSYDHSRVMAITFDGSGNLYAGGDFYTAGSANVNMVAKWNGNAWSALDKGLSGGVVSALAFDRSSGNLYASGGFISTTGGAVSTKYIAKWDGNVWFALGSGMDGIVDALAVDGSGFLSAGGSFSTAGGTAASHIAELK